MSAKEYYELFLNNDPKFKEFVESNKDKTYQQIALENGIDLSTLDEKGQQAV